MFIDLDVKQTLSEIIQDKTFTKNNAGITRIEIKAPDMDILNWLRRQNHPVKIFWASRDDDIKVAGIGIADLVSGAVYEDYNRFFARISQHLQNADENVRYYGGMGFDPSHSIDREWEGFGRCNFFVPQVELLKRNGETICAVNILNNDMDYLEEIQTLLTSLDFSGIILNERLPLLDNITRIPDFYGWAVNVEKALEAIKSGSVQKVVLAGKSVLELSSALCPVHLLQKMTPMHKGVYRFCFQTAKNQAFLGVTPERLYKRDGREIFSEAVAGTRSRGEDDILDSRLGVALLNSDKDLREHRWVVDMIRNSLEPVCSELTITGQEELFKLQHVQHLRTLFKGVLNKAVTDNQIIAALHPTPAVGGFPGKESLALISKLEPFDRGWYAGPVGWIGRDAAEFAVAIRSGLVDDKKLILFAGSGIVNGSDPQKEWEENETKILNFTRMFENL